MSGTRIDDEPATLAPAGGSGAWLSPGAPSPLSDGLPELRPAGPGAMGEEPPVPQPPSGFWRRAARGRPQDPAWVRPALIALLVGTAVLYLWGLGASGWANSFYSAAVQAGTRSWKAFFFGSSDAANFITVDKPPASLWVMDLSARLFGVNAWSILVPQALEGVATVWVLFVAVRRWFGAPAGLLAGTVLALTPVATLMFRFNNPDALLVLLLTVSAYATVRAVEAGKARWMVLAGACIGFGFITKMLQALILLPVLGLVYLLAGKPGLVRRLLHVIAAGVAAIVAGGWWVAAVQLTPAADRPYIGGSADNNLLNLIFGYNGFGRLTGNETGSVGGGTAGRFGPGGGGGGGGGATSMWGPVGWDRLFLREMGGQISWLIPASLIGLVAVLWVTRRAPRTDRVRAGVLLFGGWLLLTGAVFSFAQGIIHPYYTVALAPAVGALVGMGAVTLWRGRDRVFPRCALAAGIVASVVWGFVILSWSPTWNPALRWVVLVVGLVAASALLIWAGRSASAGPWRKWSVVAIATAGLGAVAAGPAAYAVQTASVPHDGSIPSAGPAVQGGSGFPGGGPGGAFGGGAAGGAFPGGRFARRGAGGGAVPGGAVPGGGFPGGGFPGGGFPGGGFPGGGFPGGGTFPGGALRGGRFGGGGFGGGGQARGPGGAGGAGGLLDGSTPGAQVTAALEKDASRYTWVAAAIGSNSAAGYQLATDDPIMAIGGFNGTDPAPTLAQFERYVAQGKIHYLIGGGGFGNGQGASGESDATQISAWVSSHYTATTVDGVTLYDLTAAKG